jgi:hypothetical protein
MHDQDLTPARPPKELPDLADLKRSERAMLVLELPEGHQPLTPGGAGGVVGAVAGRLE